MVKAQGGGMNLRKLLEQLQGKNKYPDKEKGKYVRLVYPVFRRPVFKVKEQEMQVIDISEKGIKISRDKQGKIPECVYGTSTLLSGRTIDIAGKIVWQTENEVGLLVARISQAVIAGEIRAVMRSFGSDDGAETD